jgi:hypothetical protein
VAILALSAALSAGCSTPFHMSDAHVTSTPRSPSLDIAVLACEPVATLGPAAPSGIQGLSPTVSHALTTALSEASPPIRVVPMPDTLNRLNDQGLAGEYADMLSGFARSGILERERLQRIGAALRSRYMLQPGLAEFNRVLTDKFEIASWKILRTRLSTLRLWLQVWDSGGPGRQRGIDRVPLRDRAEAVVAHGQGRPARGKERTLALSLSRRLVSMAS